MKNDSFLKESTPIMSGEWSKAYVALNTNSTDEIRQMRKLHKWMHFFMPEKFIRKKILDK